MMAMYIIGIFIFFRLFNFLFLIKCFNLKKFKNLKKNLNDLKLIRSKILKFSLLGRT